MGKNGRGEYWVGFDLGGTKMLSTVFNDQFKILGRKRRKTKANEGVKAGLDRIVETVHDALVDAGVKPDDLLGIGMGCPGPLDLEKGVILDTPNLGWKNVPLRERLEQEFGCPAVIANDVDVGVYGEYYAGAAKNARCVLGVFPGTGIGGGCVYDGQLIHGKNSSCMEIGHIPVIPEGPICGCGQRGCLEAVASRLAIASAASAAAYRGDAPYLLKEAGTDLSNIRSGVLAASVEAGDTAVEEIILDASWWMGYALAGLVNALSPDIVVLGGGLVEAMPKLICNEVEKVARERVMAPFRNSFKVVPATLGDDAGVLGAAAWACRYINDRGKKKGT